MNLKEYLLSFLIGANPLVITLFYYYVRDIPERRYNLAQYDLTAGLYFGTMNVLSKYLGINFGLSLRTCLIMINIVAILFTEYLVK